MKYYVVVRNAQVTGMHVSSAFCIGFPAMTSFAGLAQAYVIGLGDYFGLEHGELDNKGILVSFSDYQFLDSYRKTRKPKSNDFQQIVQAYANGTFTFIFAIEPKTAKAEQALQEGWKQASAAVLENLKVAKGTLRIDARKVSVFDDEESAVKQIPSQYWVARDVGWLVENMREKGLNVVDGLVQSTLQHNLRLDNWKKFFEEAGAEQFKLIATQIGYLQIDFEGLVKGNRKNLLGQPQDAFVASPVLGLVRLQKAASVRAHAEDSYPFWNFHTDSNGVWVCRDFQA